jgi:hypothetical protein
VPIALRSGSLNFLEISESVQACNGIALQTDKRRLTSTRCFFFQKKKTAGYTLFEHKRKEKILEEFKVEPVGEKLRRCKSDWLPVTRMNNKMQKNNAEL